MASLTIKNVRQTFGGTEVLKDISLSASSGEFLVLVGPSGCGKSTLLNLIAGLETISSGEILIGNRIVNDVSPKDRDIAMVFQSYALYPNMNVRQNLSFGLESRKVPKQEIAATIERISTLLQINNLLDRKPSQLSGGQRQRVAMGRALTRNPKIFLFDEPLSNLDAKLRVEMRTEIKLLHQRIKTTIVYVTHDQTEAMTLADRIAIMKDGQLQQFDTPQMVYKNPANRFVAGFIGSPSMNFIPSRVIQNGTDPGLLFDTGHASPQTIVFKKRNKTLRAWKDKNIIVGIRPEHISDGFSHQDNDYRIQKLSCIVRVVEPNGPDTLVFVNINDREVACRVQPEAARSPGERMTLQMNISKALFFNPENGERIDSL